MIDHLSQIPRWTLSADGKSISREYVFTDFKEAFAFLTIVAELAERVNHHPTIWNSWNKVRLELTTHDIRALSEKDIALAAAIDQRQQ